jgi:hypothetical protein
MMRSEDTSHAMRRHYRLFGSPLTAACIRAAAM